MYYVFSIFVLVMYSREEPNAKILNKLDKLLKHKRFFIINILRLIATTHPAAYSSYKKSVAEEFRTLK